MTPAENAAVLATSGATTKDEDSYFLKDFVENFGAQWDDEAIQRRDKSSSRRRAAHLTAAASSWEHQLVSPTFFLSKMADHDEYEQEEEEWVEEADAYHGNDDEWDEERKNMLPRQK